MYEKMRNLTSTGQIRSSLLQDVALCKVLNTFINPERQRELGCHCLSLVYFTWCCFFLYSHFWWYPAHQCLVIPNISLRACATTLSLPASESKNGHTATLNKNWVSLQKHFQVLLHCSGRAKVIGYQLACVHGLQIACENTEF